MKIIVCVRQIPNPDEYPENIQIDTKKSKIKSKPTIINPSDQNAVETALRISKNLDAEITGLGLSPESNQNTLRSLNTILDELILLRDDEFKDLTPKSSALVFSKAIKKQGEFDLIIIGGSLADWNTVATGPFISEIIGTPCVNSVKELEVKEDDIITERTCYGRTELIKVKTPCVITMRDKIGNMRYLSVRNQKLAQIQQAKIWNKDILGIKNSDIEKRKISSVSFSGNTEECEIIEGQTIERKTEKFLSRLMEDLGLYQEN